MFKVFKNIEHARVVGAVDEESSFTGKFFILLILSTVIATLGLIADNISVVIGAMIIAPLMWPILGLSLSITRQNRRFFRESVALLVISVILSVAVAAGVSLLSPILEINGAILERTNPNIIDLVIALATGAVATYIVLTPKSNHLAGVAVAAALIPPLSAAGISIALADLAATQGALLLFGANLFAIVFMSIILLTIGGFAKAKKEEEKVNITISLVVSLGLLILIAAPLGVVLKDSLDIQNQEAVVYDSLLQEFKKINSDAKISSLMVRGLEPSTDIIEIEATIQAPLGTDFFIADQERIAKKITNTIDKAVTLTIIITPTLTAKTPVPLNTDDIHAITTDIIKKKITGVSVISITTDSSNDHPSLTAIIALPAPLAEKQSIALEIEKQLEEELNQNITLTLNVITYQATESVEN